MPDVVHLNDRAIYRSQMTEILLLPLEARTTSSNLVVSGMNLQKYDAALVLLNVTAAATAVGDTLDVYLQKNVSIPGTPIWTDFVHFTQVLGNGGAKQFVAEITQEDITSGLHVVQDAAMTAGVNGGPWGDMWRVKWVIAGATPSFTFSLYAHLIGGD